MSLANPYTDDFSQASEYLRLTLAFLSKHKIPASPFNYCIGYEFVTGRSQKLQAALEQLLQENPQPDQDVLFALYRSHILQDDKALESVRNELQKVIGSMQQDYDDSRTGLNDFISSLNHFSGILADPQQPGLQQEVQKVMDETRSTESSQRGLENRMNSMMEEVELLRKQLEQAREESLTDALTGIANRKAFDQFLEQTHRKSLEQGEQYSLVIADIDHFKNFNDTYGHLVGDKVLRYVATTIQASVKGKDMAARFGGEEFVVVLPSTEADNAAVVAEQIRKAVSARELKDKRANKDFGRITISLGVAQCTPEEPPQDLLKRADEALYAAKRNGRNQVGMAQANSGFAAAI